MSLDAANSITGFSRVAGFLMGFLAGWLVDRAGLKVAMFLCLAASGLFTILLSLFHGPLLTPLLVFFQVSSVVCFFPVGYTALSMIFSTSIRNLAVSIVLLRSYLLGVGFFPVGIGYIAEKLSFSRSFLLIGLLTLSTLPLVLLRMPHKETYSG